MKLLRNKDVANEYIKTVYQILLGREPDEDGLSNYSRVLEDSGVSGFAQILVSVAKSAEFKKLNSAPAFQCAIDEYIKAVYSTLVGRQPDEDGFNYYRNLLNAAGSSGFSQMLESVSKSEEFKSIHAITSSNNSLEKFKEFDFSSITSNDLNALFEKTAFYWRGLDLSPEEIYWSVLSADEYRGVLSEDQIKDFLATGNVDVRRISRICEEVNFKFEECTEFLDYGCGVGRLAVNLPGSIKKINCVDFSSPHLQEAELNFSRLGISGKHQMYKLEAISDLESLPDNQNIIHSFIVLQHNTPPVIEKTVLSLLRLLSTGGIAILHIPIAKASYEFDVKSYLASEKSGKSIEMHILPKKNLFQAARNSGCEIVYSCCEGGCGIDIYSEIVVFRKI